MEWIDVALGTLIVAFCLIGPTIRLRSVIRYGKPGESCGGAPPFYELPANEWRDCE